MQHPWEANDASQRARASNQPGGPPYQGPFLGGWAASAMLGSTQSDQLPSIGGVDFTLRGLPSGSTSHLDPRSLPLVTHPHPHLNPILVPRQGLMYDVRSGPLGARFTFAEAGERWKNQAATVPSVPFMTIACSRFEDPLVVLPMVSTSEKVTVLDILFAVHKRVQQGPRNPPTSSLLEPVGHRGVGRARQAPNWPARPSLDSGSVHFGSSRLANGNGRGVEVNSVGRWDPAVYNQGWMWVGIMPSKDEQGVWVLELS